MDDSKYQIDLLTALNSKLMNSEKMYRHICECTGNLCMYFDYKVSPVKVDLIGPWDEVLGMRLTNHPYDESYMLNFIYEADQDDFRNKLLEMERDNSTEAKLEIRSRNKNHWLLAEAKVSYDSNGYPLEKIIILTDITKSKINSEELEYLAYYDTLTGLYNRNNFLRLLRDLCEKAAAEKASVEVMFIDIDDFKKINDSIGLLYGDELVQEFGQYLKEFNSNEINVGRYGSDVFIISIYNPCGLRSANVLYRQISERLRKPFVLSNKQEINISVTVGVAEYPDAGTTSLEVIKNTEIVLYKAKDKEKGSIMYFDPVIIDKFIKNISLEKKLEDATQNEDFVLYYQPIFNLENGQLKSAEVLIRWPDNRGGFISSPLEFIKLAEKNGNINKLGNWIIKEAIRTLNDWRIKYRVPISICLNISAKQLESDDFIDYIQEVLDLYNINPEQIEIELKESVFLDDFDDIIDRIRTIRGIGMKVSLDNFGTGYSSLTNLKNLQIDTIKIDRTLIDAAITDEASSTITEAIIKMSKKLGYKTVAQGVETKEQFNYLRKNKCDFIQGFLLGKPVNKNEFEKVIIRQMP